MCCNCRINGDNLAELYSMRQLWVQLVIFTSYYIGALSSLSIYANSFILIEQTVDKY